MNRTIDAISCREEEELSASELVLDRERSSFILRKKIRSVSGRKRLGLAWIVIDPIVTSLIYLFVLTILRARSDPESLFIGIALYGVLQNSIKSGSASIRDITGGFKAERVRTRTMVMSTIKYRLIDTIASTIGVAGILLFFYEIDILGVILFVIISSIVGITFEGIGLSLSLIMRRIPDLVNVTNLFLRLMFFAGPVMYPMAATSGVHYNINLFNPFTYFVEVARYFSAQESIVNSVNEVYFILVFSLCIFVSILGYLRMDKTRWVISSWS
jgi:ABC-type polysaccharide/polyol phosphate export permease